MNTLGVDSVEALKENEKTDKLSPPLRESPRSFERMDSDQSKQGIITPRSKSATIPNNATMKALKILGPQTPDPGIGNMYIPSEQAVNQKLAKMMV